MVKLHIIASLLTLNLVIIGDEEAENYREKIVQVATGLIGAKSARYRQNHPEFGQSAEYGFDCSGFVSFVLRSAGVKIGEYMGADNAVRPVRHANEYWDHFGVAVQSGNHIAGDCIFFSRNGVFPTHIGIVVASDRYVHAPGRDGTLVEESLIEPEEIHAPATEHRVLYTANPIGYKSFTVPLANPTYRYHQGIIA